MSEKVHEADDVMAATRVLHLKHYYVRHPHMLFPDVLHEGRFIPGAARRDANSAADEIYVTDLRAPAGDLVYNVLLAGRSEWRYGDRYTRNHARHFALELVTHGQGELRVGRRKPVVLKPGDVFILHPGERHTYCAVSRAPFKKIFVTLRAGTAMQREALALTPLWRRSHVTLAPARARRAEALLERIIAVLREGGSEAPLRASVAAYELISVVLQAERQAAEEPRLDGRIEAAMAYVISHITERLSVNSMARQAGVSPDHLNRLFVKEVGMRAHEWLVNLRMLFAAELLQKTRAPVHEIAERAGYDNSTAFLRMFKQVTGLSPRSYRRRVWEGGAANTAARVPR